MVSRGPDRRRKLSPLCREGSPADTSSRRHRRSWTISAATKARSCASSSAPPGAKLFFLPKYSPDLNPIEQVFAKLKHLPAKSCRPNGRSGLRSPSVKLSSLHARRMRKLLRKLRISTNLNSSCFSVIGGVRFLGGMPKSSFTFAIIASTFFLLTAYARRLKSERGRYFWSPVPIACGFTSIDPRSAK